MFFPRADYRLTETRKAAEAATTTVVSTASAAAPADERFIYDRDHNGRIDGLRKHHVLTKRGLCYEPQIDPDQGRAGEHPGAGRIWLEPQRDRRASWLQALDAKGALFSGAYSAATSPQRPAQAASENRADQDRDQHGRRGAVRFHGRCQGHDGERFRVAAA